MTMVLKDFVGQLNLEESAALETTVLIADYNDVLTWPDLPDLAAAATNEAYVTLTGTFVMKATKQFHEFHCSLEKNAFTSTLVGSRGALSFENILTFVKNAVNAPLLGFLRANRNRPLVVAFKMLGETQYCVLGWKDLWAEIEGADLEVAAEVSGDKMTATRVRSIFYPPLYIAAVPLVPPL